MNTKKKERLLKNNPLYAGNNIRTYSGKYIDVFNLTEDDINIVDIVHALSYVPRYGGHMKKQITVLRHTLNVAGYLNNLKDIFAALLHDASEAYLCDIPKPIKEKLPEYKKLEHQVMTLIANKYGFEYPLNSRVKKADEQALEFEFLHYKLEYNLLERLKDIFLLRNNRWVLRRRFYKLLSKCCNG